MNEKLTLEYWELKLKKEDYWLECMILVHKGKDINEAIKLTFLHLLADETRLLNSDISDFKKTVSNFAGNMRANENRKEALDKMVWMKAMK